MNRLKDVPFYIAITIIYLLIAYYPVVRSAFIAPADRWYWGSATYPLDFLGNLTIVRKGYLGMWNGYLTLWQINPEKILHPDSRDVMKYEYLLTGHLARVFGMDTLVTLNTVRFTSAVLYLVLAIILIQRLTPDRFVRRMTYVLILFAAPITVPGQLYESTQLARIGDSVHPLQRYFFVSLHYLLGNIGMLAAMLHAGRFFERHTWRDAWWSVAWGCFTSYVNFPSLLFLWIGMVGTTLFRILFRLFGRGMWKHVGFAVLFTLVFVGVTYLPALVIQKDLKEYFWMIQEIAFAGITAGDYFLAMGPVVVAAVIGLIQVKKCLGSPLHIMTLSMVFSHAASSLLSEHVTQFSAKRAFQTPYLIAVAYLAALGIHTIRKRIPLTSGKRVLVTAVLFGMLILPSAYTFYVSLLDECFCIPSPMDFAFPKRDLMEGIFWLRDHTAEDDIVLSGYHAGTLVPAFSGNRTYVSWFIYLAVARHYTADRIKEFYRGTLSDWDVTRFLTNARIRYVVYGDEERRLGNSVTLPYRQLEEVFAAENTKIFRIRL